MTLNRWLTCHHRLARRFVHQRCEGALGQHHGLYQRHEDAGAAVRRLITLTPHTPTVSVAAERADPPRWQVYFDYFTGKGDRHADFWEVDEERARDSPFFPKPLLLHGTPNTAHHPHFGRSARRSDPQLPSLLGPAAVLRASVSTLLQHMHRSRQRATSLSILALTVSSLSCVFTSLETCVSQSSSERCAKAKQCATPLPTASLARRKRAPSDHLTPDDRGRRAPYRATRACD